MKRVRCQECGMSLKYNPGDLIVTCHMCGKKTWITQETIIPSIEDYYDASDYQCDCDNEVKKDSSQESIFCSNENVSKDSLKDYFKDHFRVVRVGKKNSAPIGIIIFIIFFLIMVFSIIAEILSFN